MKKILRSIDLAGADTNGDAQPRRLRNSDGHDFHSFRVTWVTLALSGRVPIELVRRVTGHSTAEVVLKHYHQPGRDHLRRGLKDKMPAFLSARPDDSAAVDDTIRRLKELTVDLDRDNFPQRRGQILEMVR